MKDLPQKHYDRFISRICKVGFIDTMQTIWGYIRNLHYNKPIPSDIETPPKYNDYQDPNYKRTVGIGEWEFDIILLYSILYSPKETVSFYSLKKFSYLRLVVNDIRLIRDEIDKIIIPQKEDVFKEFFRIMHRQYYWQQSLNKTYTYRFYRIFNHPYLGGLIKQKTNLEIKDLYRSGLLMTGYFINNFFCPIPLKTEIPWFTQKMFDSFLGFFGISTTDFIKRFKDKITFDDTFQYKFNPLRSYPLLIHKNHIYCPIPAYIMWKISNGIYYDIVNEKGFDKAFGESFQDYCGFVCKRVLKRIHIQIHPEINYGKSMKKSSDWIIEEDNTHLFIECKAKRLKLDSITRFYNNEDLKEDICKMVGFIFQAYKSLNDAINNKIPNITIRSNSQVRIIILTLDEWHLDLDPFINKQIVNDLKLEFNRAKLDTFLIEKYPFLIRSINHFETDCQIINKFGLLEYHQRLVNNSLSDIYDSFVFEDIFANEIESELLSIIE